MWTKPEFLARWDAVLHEPENYNQISEVEHTWPSKSSVTIPFERLLHADEELAYRYTKQYETCMEAATEAVRNLVPPDLTEMKRKLGVRVSGIPFCEEIAIHQIRGAHVGVMVKANARVKKVSLRHQKIKVGVFQCLRCGAITEVPTEGFNLVHPLECSESNGGCGRSSSTTRWREINKVPGDDGEPVGHVYGDLQWVHVEDYYDPTVAHSPAIRRVALWDDLADFKHAASGVFCGIVKTSPKWNGKHQSAIPETYIEGVSFETDSESRAVKVTPEDVQTIKAFAAQGEDAVFRDLVASLAPAIYGHELVKLAIVLQLFGGVAKTLPDKTNLRGDSHILLVGDPSTAKSQLLKAAARLAPIATWAVGEQSSGPGLTIAFSRDEIDGSWTFELGPLPQADGGLCCLDELDKLKESSRQALHSALEQQEIAYSKAGKTGTVSCRMSLLAAANPKSGRFNEGEGLMDQYDLTPALFSRFDLIFTILDKPNAEKDSKIMDHIYATRSGDPERIPAPPLSPEFFRKYLAWARENIHPDIPETSYRRIRDWYVARRAQNDGGKILAATVRQGEGIFRLAQASAKARLSASVDLGDVERAITLFEASMKDSATNEDGRIDLTIIHSGKSQAQWDRIRMLLETIRSFAAGSSEGADKDKVIQDLVAQGIPEERVRADIDKLLREGRIFSPRQNDHYRVLE